MVQFIAQPLFAIFYVLFVIAVLAIGAFGGGSIGGPGDLSFPKGYFLGFRRYRLERSGRPTDWVAWVANVISKDGTKAQVRALKRHKNIQHVEELPKIYLSARDYRGVGADAAGAVASEQGWAIDWNQSPKPERFLVLIGKDPESLRGSLLT